MCLPLGIPQLAREGARVLDWEKRWPQGRHTYFTVEKTETHRKEVTCSKP